MNSEVVAALRTVEARPLHGRRVFLNEDEVPLVGYKHWFGPALKTVKLCDTGVTWYTFAPFVRLAADDGGREPADGSGSVGTFDGANDDAILALGSGVQAGCSRETSCAQLRLWRH
jgi:hypothetical protein